MGSPSVDRLDRLLLEIFFCVIITGVSLAMAADGTPMIFWTFRSSCLQKCILLLLDYSDFYDWLLWHNLPNFYFVINLKALCLSMQDAHDFTCTKFCYLSRVTCSRSTIMNFFLCTAKPGFHQIYDVISVLLLYVDFYDQLRFNSLRNLMSFLILRKMKTRD
jgi:hypothetical protein